MSTRRPPGLLRPKADKMNLHPRNRHTSRYDFPALTKSSPELAEFVAKNPYGDLSIDFANPKAVIALNRALLRHFYGVKEWGIPEGYLTPPIPGRADYLHYLADLLALGNGRQIPRGPGVRVLDIGTGASCIYPLIGQSEYGWNFVGSEVDFAALKSAESIVAESPGLGAKIELRRQTDPTKIFPNIIRPGELFDAVMSNPPFHGSLEEAQEGSRRKWKNLGRESERGSPGVKKPVLNFGGQGGELWCKGGEVAFVKKMILESEFFAKQVFWFSSLVSKSASLPMIYDTLDGSKATDVQTIDMSQGQKKSRVIAWTFLAPGEQTAWRARWR